MGVSVFLTKDQIILQEYRTSMCTCTVHLLIRKRTQHTYSYILSRSIHYYVSMSAVSARLKYKYTVRQYNIYIFLQTGALEGILEVLNLIDIILHTSRYKILKLYLNYSKIIFWKTILQFL